MRAATGSKSPSPIRRGATTCSRAYLALGGFGYDPAAGPGVVVSWFPGNYSGPLKPGDRIVSVGGTNLADGRAYARFMDQARDEKPVAVVVQRGKQRVRIETRIVLPKREENITVRVRAEWTAETRELLIVSRGVGKCASTCRRPGSPPPSTGTAKRR